MLTFARVLYTAIYLILSPSVAFSFHFISKGCKTPSMMHFTALQMACSKMSQIFSLIFVEKCISSQERKYETDTAVVIEHIGG